MTTSPNPFVFRHERTCYAIGTGRDEADGNVDARGAITGAAERELADRLSVFPIASSMKKTRLSLLA